MRITIEGESKEITDFAFGIQNRLSPKEFDLYFKEISSASRDNA